jgi:hypothetical protein
VEQIRDGQGEFASKPLILIPGVTITVPTDIPIHLDGYPKIAFVYSLGENKRYKNLSAEKGSTRYKFIS